MCMALEGLLTKICEERNAYLALASGSSERAGYIAGLDKAIAYVNEYSALIESKIESIIKEKEERKKYWSDYLVSHKSEVIGIKEVADMLMTLIYGNGGGS